MLSALQIKLIRDLWHMRGQSIAIALVIGCGIATFVMSVSMLRSLQRTMEAYYLDYRFAHVFAHVKRAPLHLREYVEAIPGVAHVQMRVVFDVNLNVEGMHEPAMGKLISVPDLAPPDINRLHIRQGRYLEPGRENEVLVSEAFANAHGLQPDQTVEAIINGRLNTLRIVGIALSPEYIYQIRPGEILPDDRRFAVMWMGERQLSAVLDMEGAFNDLCVTLAHGPPTLQTEVIKRLDALLEPYGTLGAYGREDQPSHVFVSNELRELRGMAMIAPTIFLVVSAFLLNVVMSRLVSTQREQIATLKAFGYSRWEVAWHYIQFVAAIVVVGAVIGLLTGSWMGQQMTLLYARFFHFPMLVYTLEREVITAAVAVSMAAGLAGTIGAVMRASSLPPADAMRPEAPAHFRATILERIGLQRLVPPVARMILRELERRPFKAMTSVLGISLATAILVVGAFMKDAIDHVMALQFEQAQRQDLTVVFTNAVHRSVVADLHQMPGVRAVEPFRSVPVRLINGERNDRVSVTCLRETNTAFRLLDNHGRELAMVSDGIYMSAKLGEKLGVRAGGWVDMDVMEDTRLSERMQVAGFIDDFSGLSAYMRLDAMHRLLREEDRVNGAHLEIDRSKTDELYVILKNTPMVASVILKDAAREAFEAIVAENLLRIRLFNIAFAVIIAFGVVYNSARIALAERGRELATLRVIGFRRSEVSAILLGELAVLALIAIPLGLVFGSRLAWLVVHSVDSELFRIPLIIERSTYGFAAVVIMLATAASAMIVRHRIDHFDLISVLKTRE